MKKLSLIIILFSLVCFSSKGQGTLVDSLLNQVSTTQNDSIKVESYNELAWVYRLKNTTLALSYADSAIRISERTEYLAGLSTGYVRVGLVRMNLGDFIQARSDYLKALQIDKSINNQYGIARASNQLSIIEKSLGNIHLAISYSKNAVAMLQITGPKQVLADAIDNLGQAYIVAGTYDSALFQLNIALEIRESEKMYSELSKSFLNHGYLFYETEDYDQSIEFATKAIDIYKNSSDKVSLAKSHEVLASSYYKKGTFDNAEANYLKSLALREVIGLGPEMANSYNNLGLIYEIKGDFDQASAYILRGLKTLNRTGNTKGIISANINLGNVKLKSNHYKLAESYYLEAFNLAEAQDLLISFPEITSKLTDIYIGTNQVENALKYSLLNNELKDNIQTTLRKAKNLEIAIAHEKSENQLLKEQQISSELQDEKSALIITSLVIGIALLTVLFATLVGYYRLGQKKTIAEKNEKIKHQENEDLLKNQELAAMGAMLEGQEKERRRISRELHDRLGSMLSVVKIHFKSVEQNLDQLKLKNLEQYQKANQLLDDACDEVRKVAHDMVSGVLMKFGLVKALRNLCSSVESTGQLKMELLDFGLDERLEVEYEITVYRIIQELLSNVLKHAAASEMTIQLLKKGDMLSIVVEDNGIGFDEDIPDFEAGMGLKNITSRVHKYGGEFNIDSGKGAGTTITIELKIQDLKDD